MRLGLLADIHEDLEMLNEALSRFERDAVDRVVVLGDVFDTGKWLEETVRCLSARGAIGVWGNHDVGLSNNPDSWVVKRFGSETIAFMTSLRPSLAIGDCHFSHVEPWLDPNDVSELWHFGGPPSTAEELAKSFDAVPHRLLLLGHYHRWSIATRECRVPWDAFQPFPFEPGRRYLIILGAVCDGRCGILDTERQLLIPVDLRDG